MDEDRNQNTLSREDRLSNFMFGPRRNIDQSELPEIQRSNEPSIDYEELMIHIDTLMTSAQNLKPLFQKVYPFIQQIWKKK